MVKRRYQQAGILTLSDPAVLRSLEKIQQEYRKIMSLRNKETPGALLKKQEFEVEIKKTFDIKDANARTAIETDPNRSHKSKEDDLKFFDDNFGDNPSRKFKFSLRDTTYDSALSKTAAIEVRRIERQARLEEQKEQEQIEIQENLGLVKTPGDDIENNEELEQEEGNSDAQDEEEVAGCEKVVRSRRKRRRTGQSGPGGNESDEEETGEAATIPHDILKITSANAVRFGLSHGQHVSMTAAFIRACNVELDNFSLSYATSYRMRKEVLEESYLESREKFRRQAIEGNWPLIVHPDTKELSGTIGPRGASVVNNVERLAMVVTSPLFDGEQFVCAPGLERTTGRAQADGAIEGLRELGVLDLVVGVSYDTTASNSSPQVGTVALIEQEIGEQLLKLPCRHHMIDLHGKNTRRVAVGGRSLGPKHPIFVRLAREWPELVDNIDYNNLATSDMGPWRGTFLEGVVEDLRVWCRRALLYNTFSKGSFTDLLHSMIKFIGGYPLGFSMVLTY